ncbi:MAG: peptidoglycan DD-metalloendopeptidase family protein, partial [Actinomycetota bacterium]
MAAVLGLASFPAAAVDESTTTTTAPPTTAPPTTAAPTTPAPSTAPPTTAAPTTAAPTTASPGSSTTLSPEDEAKKREAAGNLNRAKAADADVQRALVEINSETQSTRSKIDKVQAQLERAKATMQTARTEMVESSTEQTKIESQLRSKAVEGFKSGINDPGPFFTDRNINQSIRQTQLLQQANTSTAELLDELRIIREDQQVAEAEASQAVSDAEALEQELQAQLDTLQAQETIQLGLKAEAESRIARWAADLTAYAAEDASIQNLIAGSTPAPVSVPAPSVPSALGYQWPLSGRVSSPFGYRTHPVFGTRKLHPGLDVAAPRGTPIAATSGGTVIYTGYRGGYGNTVIVDHGGGFTSLYAHMSEIGISNGASVDRGDIVGRVGATGTATVEPDLEVEMVAGGGAGGADAAHDVTTVDAG